MTDQELLSVLVSGVLGSFVGIGFWILCVWISDLIEQKFKK